MSVSWGQAQLDELACFERGLTYTKKDEVDFSSSAILRANNITLENNQLNLNEMRYIRDAVQIPRSKRVRSGSILICTASGSKSHLGKVALIRDDIDYAFGGFMGLITPNQGILAEFLYYFLTSPIYRSHIAMLTDGTNINNLKWSQLRSLVVPVPPLEEQRRIVAVLDAAFEGLKVAQANTEANLASAGELFEAQLSVEFPRSTKTIEIDSSQGAELTRLGDIVEIGPKKQQVKDSLADFTKVSFVPMDCLNIGKKELAEHKTREVSKVYSNYTYFADGDILLAKITPCFENGKIGIASDLTNGVGFGSSEFMVLRPKRELLPEYLYYFLNRQTFRSWASHRMTGAVGHKRVPKELVSDLYLPLKTLEEQRGTVSTLDELQNQINCIENDMIFKLSKIEELRQSLLQKAFAGELT